MVKGHIKLINEENVQIYHFARAPFGVICNPFLLSGSIQHHLNNIGTEPALKLSKELHVELQAINIRQITKEIF